MPSVIWYGCSGVCTRAQGGVSWHGGSRAPWLLMGDEGGRLFWERGETPQSRLMETCWLAGRLAGEVVLSFSLPLPVIDTALFVREKRN